MMIYHKTYVTVFLYPIPGSDYKEGQPVIDTTFNYSGFKSIHFT